MANVSNSGANGVTKDSLIEARMRNLAAFSFGPLEPYGEMIAMRDGVYRLPVRRGTAEGGGALWLGSMDLQTDSNGNPSSVHLSMSIA